MTCCDDREPVKAEASEVGPVSSLGFCSMTVGWEAACGLYIWRIAKHLHIRFVGIQGTMPFLNLQLVLFVHKKQVQTKFHKEKLKCEGVDIYTAFELLMRELTSGLATRQGIWVGELNEERPKSEPCLLSQDSLGQWPIISENSPEYKEPKDLMEIWGK